MGTATKTSLENTSLLRLCYFREYFNSLNFYKSGVLSRNQIGRSGVQVKKENEKFTVVCSRSPQNLKCGHFTLLFCSGRQGNVPECKTHVQSDSFYSLNQLFYARCRCRCGCRRRRRRRCLSSLITTESDLKCDIGKLFIYSYFKIS